MRVIAGTARRMNLSTPEGELTRPTQDRIKETLFNMIQNSVPGSVFIDVCCGSGGIGIEALSRGAARAYFLENSSRPWPHLTDNLKRTHLEERAVLLKGDALVTLRGIREDEADIIYLDPPYNGGLYVPILNTLSVMPYVSEYTMVIAECPADLDPDFAEDCGFTVEREKEYKHNKHVFFRKRMPAQ